MDFVKLDIATISCEQFRQMVTMEKNCGLEPYSPQMLRECITDMDTFALVDEGRIAGFITLHPSMRYLGGGLYIVNLNVAQDFRRQGVAKNLILSACSCFAETHTKQQVMLDVSKDNSAARNLYQKLGFTVTDEPSGNGDTDVVMAVPLEKLLQITTTTRLKLKTLTRCDTPEGIRILMNESVAKTYMLPDLTVQSATELFHRLCTLSQQNTHYIRGVYFNNRLVGFINDTEINDGQIELGWVIHPDYYNQGYATEAVSAAIKNLFARGFREVTAGAFEENKASIRVMQKCGMQLLDKTEEIDYRETTHHCVFYAVRREVN